MVEDNEGLGVVEENERLGGGRRWGVGCVIGDVEGSDVLK